MSIVASVKLSSQCFQTCTSACTQEIITIFNSLWHSNFIHVVSNALKEKKTLLHFSQVLLCSLALTYFHVFHIFLASLPLSPLSIRLLVFSTHQLLCPYCTVWAISEWSHLLVQPAHELSWNRTTASRLWLYAGYACTQSTQSQKLAPVRETPRKIRQKNITVAQWRLLQLQMLFGTKTLTTFSLNCYSSFLSFEDVLLGYY